MKGAFDLRPEQWVLFGALLLFGVITLIKAFMLPDIEVAPNTGKKQKPEVFDTSKIQNISERWEQPPVVNQTEHKVYVSRLIVYKPASQVIEPLSDDGKIQGMKVGWLKQYKLSLEDPNVGISDPDQDGFSNKEEHDQGTDPIDVISHPDFIQKLCMKDYEYIAFDLEFKDYNPIPGGEGMLYQINLPKQRKKTRMVKEGDMLKGYQIGKFEKKIIQRKNPRTGNIDTVDVSELTIVKPELPDRPIVLVKDEERQSDESKVVFQLNVPNLAPNPAEVSIGETFEVPDKTYQLIEATKDMGALIKEVSTGNELTIPPCGN